MFQLCKRVLNQNCALATLFSAESRDTPLLLTVNGVAFEKTNALILKGFIVAENIIRQADVIIAGAGIGGLTAALALHEHGINALVLESTRELKPLGVGINLQLQAADALTEMNLREQLENIAIPPQNLCI